MNKGTYTYDYPRPAVTADSVVFCNGSDGLSVLLIERANEPFKGSWAFPGGFMDMDEEAEACAIRELKKETGLQLEHMKQIGAFTDVDRDPRGRTVSIAYSALVDKKTVAAQARWFPIAEIPAQAFDHEKILRAALDALHDKHFK